MYTKYLTDMRFCFSTIEYGDKHTQKHRHTIERGIYIYPFSFPRHIESVKFKGMTFTAAQQRCARASAFSLGRSLTTKPNRHCRPRIFRPASKMDESLQSIAIHTDTAYHGPSHQRGKWCYFDKKKQIKKESTCIKNEEIET